MEEVLQHQPAEVQTFLLHTSILERFSALLCDAVLSRGAEEQGGGGKSASAPLHPCTPAQILEYLDRANLFLVPLDDRREWYRYHRLFADLLQRQLAQRHPDLVPELHRRASAWYEDQELLPESIDHALAAEDLERAAVLIAQVSEALMMRSELMTLRKWLGALPEALLNRHPDLCAYQAWLLLLSGEPLRLIESRIAAVRKHCLLYTSPSPRDLSTSRMPSSA